MSRIIVLCGVVVLLLGIGEAGASGRPHPWWDLDPGKADQQFEIGRANWRMSEAGAKASPGDGSVTLNQSRPGLLDQYDVVKLESVSLLAPKYLIRSASAYYERESTEAAKVNARIAHGYKYPNLAGDPGTTVRQILAAEKERIRFSVELLSTAGSHDMRDFRFVMETADGDSVPMRAAPLEINLEERSEYVWVARYFPEFPLRDPEGQPYLTDSTKWVRLCIISRIGRQVQVVWTLSEPPSVSVEGEKPATPSIW